MKTINLLPKARQQELRYETILHSLWIVISLSLASFAVVFLAQFGTKFYLQVEDVVIKGQVIQLKSQVDKQQNTDIKAKIQAANNLVSDYKNLSDSSPKWSKVVKAFAPLPPAGVRISTFTVDVEKKTVTIAGLAPTRELVIQLYNNILQDTADFSNIDYPLENVAQPANVAFHFTFKIKDNLYQ